MIFLACTLVHVKSAVYFNLQAVFAAGRLAVLINKLYALERIIDRDAIAEIFPENPNGFYKVRIASRAVTIAQNNIARHFFVAGQLNIAFGVSAF